MAAWDNAVPGNSFLIFHKNDYFRRFYSHITINFSIIGLNTGLVHWFHQNIDFSLANITDCTSLQPLIVLSKKHKEVSSILPNKTNLKIYCQESAIYFYLTRNSFNSVI